MTEEKNNDNTATGTPSGLDDYLEASDQGFILQINSASLSLALQNAIAQQQSLFNINSAVTTEAVNLILNDD